MDFDNDYLEYNNYELSNEELFDMIKVMCIFQIIYAFLLYYLHRLCRSYTR